MRGLHRSRRSRCGVALAQRAGRRVDRLADFPNIGRAVDEPGLENQREILYGSYRVRYRVAASVTVVGVQHTSRQVTTFDVSDL